MLNVSLVVEHMPSLGLGGECYQASYQYDAVGNRTQQVEDGATTTYTYNSTNELTQCTSATYTWDARGNLIGKVQGSETWVYTYDLANRLTEVKKNSVTLGTYAYDASGMRAKKVEGGVTTHYLTLGHQVMYEKTGTNHTRHIFAGSQRIAEVRGGEVSYFHNDHLGSPRRVTDVYGDPAGSSIATTPFGTPHATSEITSYMFTGKDLDSTGLYYFAARYYDPAVGRFVTEDTWEGRLRQPASQNRYVYVLNNPLRYIDPTGHCPQSILLEAGGPGVMASGRPEPWVIPAIISIAQGAYVAGGEMFAVLHQGIVNNVSAIVNAFSSGKDKVGGSRTGANVGGSSPNLDPGGPLGEETIVTAIKGVIENTAHHIMQARHAWDRVGVGDWASAVKVLAHVLQHGVSETYKAGNHLYSAVYNDQTVQVVIRIVDGKLRVVDAWVKTR